MTDSVGTSEYEYDEQDRLIGYTPPAPSGHASVEYAYNNLGQKTGMSTSGLGLTYEYFANGWLKAVKMGNDTIAEYEYDQVGNRIGINLGNGTHTGYTYDGDPDPRYRVTCIDHYNGQTLLGSISYPSRDGSGNPLSMIDSSGQIAYDYDMNSRLIEAGAANYSYDWVGNRLVPGSPQYNNADQLESGFGHTYNYDGRGNMIESVGANGRTFAYTPTNLLSSVTHDEVQGTPVSSMTWDGDSNRVSFTRSTGGTWQYVYDPTAGIPAVIEEVKDGVSVYYIREPNGALIARVSTNGIHYYHFDALGSTRLLTDDTGAITDEYSYDAWGNVISHDQYAGSIDQPYQFVGQLGYYTHWQDENLDLLQLGVRFYDPESGRFTQRDPVRRDEFNAFCYSDNLPTLLVDPKGEEPLTVCAVLLLAYKTATIGYGIGNGLAAGYYLVLCTGCIREAWDTVRHVRKLFKERGVNTDSCCDNEYTRWLKTTQPGAECGELCAQAGYRGIRALLGLGLRILPHCCRLPAGLR